MVSGELVLQTLRHFTVPGVNLIHLSFNALNALTGQFWHLHMVRRLLSMPLMANSMCGDEQVFGGLHFKPGDRILTSVSEYGSNFLAYLQVLHDDAHCLFVP